MKSLSQKINESLNEDSKITVFTDAKLTKKTTMAGGDIFDAQVLTSDKDVTEIHTYPPNQKTFFIATKDAHDNNILEAEEEQVDEALNYGKLAKQFVDDEWLDENDDIEDAEEYFDDKLNLFNKEELKSSKEFDNNKTKMSIEVKKLLKGKLKTIFESAEEITESSLTFKQLFDKYADDPKSIGANATTFSDGDGSMTFNFLSKSDRAKTLKTLKNLGFSDENLTLADKDDFYKFKLIVVESAEEITEAKIESDEDFIEYGEKLLKKAHGDDYDQAKADKTLKGILKDAGDDYGKAVGALTNGLKEDGDAEDVVDESSTDIEKKWNDANSNDRKNMLSSVSIDPRDSPKYLSSDFDELPQKIQNDLKS